MFIIFQAVCRIAVTSNIVIQGIGFIGLTLAFISFQSNKRHLILIFLGISQFFYAVHFAFLGGWTAFAMNIVGMTRSFLFTQKGKKKWLENNAMMYLFILCFWIAGILSWSGWISVLPILAMTIETVSLWMKNPTRIRFIILFPRPMWFTYNFIYRSYPGMLSEIFVISSIISGIIRFDIIPKISRRRNLKKQEQNKQY
jgi:hypothetical protein